MLMERGKTKKGDGYNKEWYEVSEEDAGYRSLQNLKTRVISPK